MNSHVASHKGRYLDRCYILPPNTRKTSVMGVGTVKRRDGESNLFYRPELTLVDLDGVVRVGELVPRFMYEVDGIKHAVAYEDVRSSNSLKTSAGSTHKGITEAAVATWTRDQDARLFKDTTPHLEALSNRYHKMSRSPRFTVDDIDEFVREHLSVAELEEAFATVRADTAASYRYEVPLLLTWPKGDQVEETSASSNASNQVQSVSVTGASSTDGKLLGRILVNASGSKAPLHVQIGAVIPLDQTVAPLYHRPELTLVIRAGKIQAGGVVARLWYELDEVDILVTYDEILTVTKKNGRELATAAYDGPAPKPVGTWLPTTRPHSHENAAMHLSRLEKLYHKICKTDLFTADGISRYLQINNRGRTLLNAAYMDLKSGGATSGTLREVIIQVPWIPDHRILGGDVEGDTGNQPDPALMSTNPTASRKDAKIAVQSHQTMAIRPAAKPTPEASGPAVHAQVPPSAADTSAPQSPGLPPHEIKDRQPVPTGEVERYKAPAKVRE